ncbi:MAG: ribosomal protein S18-alanine N-acetyltransferase [Candidatus Nanopelagicales bacterium]
MSELREFRYWHIPQAHQIELTVFPETAWSEATFWSELAADNRYYLCFEENEELIGYGGIALKGSEADLQTLVIKPEFQQKGLASELITKLLEKTKESDAKRVFLEVVFDNEPAIALYKKFKFEQIALRQKYYPNGKAAVIMQLDWRG